MPKNISMCGNLVILFYGLSGSKLIVTYIGTINIFLIQPLGTSDGVSYAVLKHPTPIISAQAPPQALPGKRSACCIPLIYMIFTNTGNTIIF